MLDQKIIQKGLKSNIENEEIDLSIIDLEKLIEKILLNLKKRNTSFSVTNIRKMIQVDYRINISSRTISRKANIMIKHLLNQNKIKSSDYPKRKLRYRFNPN